MAKFKPYKIDQQMLFPPSVRDYVPESHLARLVDKVVEQLDTSAIENKYSELGQTLIIQKYSSNCYFTVTRLVTGAAEKYRANLKPIRPTCILVRCINRIFERLTIFGRRI